MRYSIYNSDGQRVLDFIVPSRTRTSIRDGVMEFKNGSSVVFAVGVGAGFSVSRSDAVVEVPSAATTPQPATATTNPPSAKIPPPPPRA